MGTPVEKDRGLYWQLTAGLASLEGWSPSCAWVQELWAAGAKDLTGGRVQGLAVDLLRGQLEVEWTAAQGGKASELCAHVWSGYTAFVKDGQRGHSLGPLLG